MEIVFWLLVVGILIVCARLLTSEQGISLEQRRRYAIKRRLQAFEHGQRVRQTAAAKRAAYELNMLAYHTYQAMLRAAIEADCRASKIPAKKRRS